MDINAIIKTAEDIEKLQKIKKELFEEVKKINLFKEESIDVEKFKRLRNIANSIIQFDAQEQILMEKIPAEIVRPTGNRRTSR